MEAYCVNFAANIKPIYWNKQNNNIYCLGKICTSYSVSIFTIIKKNCNLFILIEVGSVKTEF